MHPALTTDPRRDEVEQHAESTYAVLARRASAQGWDRDDTRSTWWLVVDEAFFEVELDLREQSAFVLFGPLRDGRRPGGYYVDSSRTKVRWHLSAALKQAGVDPGSPSVDLGGLQGPERVNRAVDANLGDVEAALAHLPELVRACRDDVGGTR